MHSGSLVEQLWCSQSREQGAAQSLKRYQITHLTVAVILDSLLVFCSTKQSKDVSSGQTCTREDGVARVFCRKHAVLLFFFFFCIPSVDGYYCEKNVVLYVVVRDAEIFFIKSGFMCAPRDTGHFSLYEKELCKTAKHMNYEYVPVSCNIKITHHIVLCWGSIGNVWLFPCAIHIFQSHVPSQWCRTIFVGI